MSPRREWFQDNSYENLKQNIPISLGDGSTIHATAKGSIKFRMQVDGTERTIIIPNVLYAPKLATTLLSVAGFTT
ncbi:hypothetical protein BS47DRAFT_1292664 [Hydnum rufescens UP504]|uniref:Retrovirus-related Pol polyprotein from transposon TNT 1-94-like beta-barrel domain-containing protein n=1 Tax=Hydnum rufescens UP504 TaxID=1448309 RepID=A0A9P6DWD4_9AGAM|nr:hypothetical protein BS47DRAFT_1292664 [Hydnum rufescens UP504]